MFCTCVSHVCFARVFLVQLEWIRQALSENEKTMHKIERDAKQLQAEAARVGTALHDVHRR